MDKCASCGETDDDLTPCNECGRWTCEECGEWCRIAYGAEGGTWFCHECMEQ